MGVDTRLGQGEVRAVKRRWTLRRAGQSTIIHLVVISSAVLIGFPFFYMVTSAFKTMSEIYTIPTVWLPATLQWRNFADAWTNVPFARYTINSTVYTLACTMGQFCLGLTAGYAFGRLRFPKKDLLFFLILLAFMIPGQITLVPRFMLLSDLKWLNTYPGLIVPQLGSAFVAFLLREHFRSLPDELFDAAKIDGAGHVRQLVEIALPISKPIVTTLLLLTAVNHWNEYLWPLIVTNTATMRTLPIGIQDLKDLDIGMPPQWQVLMAAATMVVLPLLVLFLAAQRQFIEGAIQGALKE
jgi:sn-glycerol 3-phosphate transport system permease protein